MDNCISVNLRKNKIVIKIAENAEQRKILSALTKKLPELKKLYRDEKTPIIIVGKVHRQAYVHIDDNKIVIE